MIGCEDLDWYGSWSMSVEYGPIWTPKSLPTGWAPYRYGHWAWVGPWGWTWIDDMAWGFAPFHYGRWALMRGAWVWVPGASARRPVYAPALVVFIEAGAVANGRIGWFPLGPWEAYVPPYTVSQAYLKKVNMTPVNIGQARHIVDSLVAMPDKELSQAWVTGTTARVTPGRGSVLVASAKPQRDVSRPPEATKKQKVIVRDAPTGSQRVIRPSGSAELRSKAQSTVQEAPQLKQHPEVKAQEPKTKTQKPRTSQKQQKVGKKRLANGQWVWVEE